MLTSIFWLEYVLKEHFAREHIKIFLEMIYLWNKLNDFLILSLLKIFYAIEPLKNKTIKLVEVIIELIIWIFVLLLHLKRKRKDCVKNFFRRIYGLIIEKGIMLFFCFKEKFWKSLLRNNESNLKREIPFYLINCCYKISIYSYYS